MTVRLAHLRLLKGSEYDLELEDGDRISIPPGGVAWEKRMGSGPFRGITSTTNKDTYRITSPSRAATRDLRQDNILTSRWTGGQSFPPGCTLSEPRDRMGNVAAWAGRVCRQGDRAGDTKARAREARLLRLDSRG
jgi:hypothetical protein